MTRSSSQTHYVLYHYQACPFCAITRAVLPSLSVSVEQRDILKKPSHRRALVKGGGKAQVPCLEIVRKDGTSDWLYESQDIIRYLKNQSKAA